MVFSKKPLHFIIATLIAFLPLINFANPNTDTTAVEKQTVETEAHSTEHNQEEPKRFKNRNQRIYFSSPFGLI